MDRIHRQGRAAGCGDRIQRQEHDPRCRRDHRLGESSHQCGGGGAHGVAAANPDHHRRRRHCGRADRPGVQLADRPQHRPPAQRPGRRDEAAGRRRHLGENSRHPRIGRDRRHGADRDRVPRQHDRARPPDLGPDQIRAREGAAQRKRRGRDRGLPRLDRAGARQPARHGATARNVLDQAQQRRRRGDRGVAHRREPRQRRLAERHLGGKLGRGTCGIDRRDRGPGREIDRGRGPRRLRGADAPPRP